MVSEATDEKLILLKACLTKIWKCTSWHGLIDQTDAMSQSPDELRFISVGNAYCNALIKGAATIETNWKNRNIDQAEAKRLAKNWIRVASGKVLVADSQNRFEAAELLKDIHEAASRLSQIIKVGASLSYGHHD